MAPTVGRHPALRNGRRGRPRQRPDKLHADKAYDARARRRECRARGIRPRIARRGIERSDRLGRHRWVVERSHAWFNRARACPSAMSGAPTHALRGGAEEADQTGFVVLKRRWVVERTLG